jgi:hypothetical protein
VAWGWAIAMTMMTIKGTPISRLLSIESGEL